MRRFLGFFLCFCIVIAVLSSTSGNTKPFSFEAFFTELSELPSKPSFPELSADWKELVPVSRPLYPQKGSTLFSWVTYIGELLFSSVPTIINALYNIDTVFRFFYDILRYVWDLSVYGVDILKTFGRACGCSFV